MNVLSENIKAIIFDIDGTIADSMGMWKEIDIEYLNRFQIPLPNDLQKKIEGMSFYETAIYFQNNFSIPDSIEKMMNDWTQMAQNKYRYEIQLKDGVKEFLKICIKKGYLLGIATSNSSTLLNCFLEQHHIKEYFHAIVTGDDGLKGKPAPDMYLEVSKKLGISAQDCLVFEDIIPGIQAAKLAGMTVCAVEDEYSKKEKEAKMEEADFFINSFNELLEER